MVAMSVMRGDTGRDEEIQGRCGEAHLWVPVGVIDDDRVHGGEIVLLLSTVATLEGQM